MNKRVNIFLMGGGGKRSCEHFQASSLTQTFWWKKCTRGIASEHQTRNQVQRGGFGLPPRLTSFNSPIVLLIERHGAKSEFTLTNICPGKRDFRSLTNREVFLRVIFFIGKNVSNLWRRRLRSAKRWLLGLNCIKYHWIIPAACESKMLSLEQI